MVGIGTLNEHAYVHVSEFPQWEDRQMMNVFDMHRVFTLIKIIELNSSKSLPQI